MSMEEASKDHSSSSTTSGTTGKSKLRYPLRSATKSKEETPSSANLPDSSAPRRGRPVSSVSKSVNVLDLSGNDKSAKPPRRLSIPAKSAARSASKPTGNITPISEARSKRSVNNGQGKSDTPMSDVSKSSSRRKFCVLASASYWLSHIKQSESAAKHSISLGFFKLALEAGCEPLQRMRDELKSYVRRHNLTELGEPVKDLFDSYNISENLEQLQVSETCSQVPDEVTRSSDDEVRSSCSTLGTRGLKPKALNTDDVQAFPVSEAAKENTQKNTPAARIRGLNKNSAYSKVVSDNKGRSIQKQPQKPSKQESSKEKGKIKKQGKKFVSEEGPINPSALDETVQENKENLDAPQREEINLDEVM